MDTQAIEALKGEALAEGAAQAEAAAAALPPGEAPPQPVDPVAEARAVFGLVVGMAAPMLPYLPAIYTDEKLDILAAAYVPVAEKYGWNVGGWLGEYSAEIALVAVAAPLAIQTAKAHREHVAALAAAKAPKEKPAPAALAPTPAPDGKLPAIEREAPEDRGGMLTAA